MSAQTNVIRKNRNIGDGRSDAGKLRNRDNMKTSAFIVNIFLIYIFAILLLFYVLFFHQL